MISDPLHLLGDIEWQTKAAFRRLSRIFQSRTGLGLKIRSGTRSCAYQNSLYAQGRTSPGPVVTDAQGCNSWHVVGRAIDADPMLPDGTISASPGDYQTAGAIWKSIGGVWGGDFASLDDVGHFEFHPGMTIGQICPVPSACREGAVDTMGPNFLLWAALGGASVGVASWWLMTTHGQKWLRARRD